MSWDGSRVRIDLCQAMSFDPETSDMAAKQAAEIYLSDDEGKVRVRKPSALLIGENRPDLLRQLANWIERRDDPSLRALVLDVDAAKHGGAT